jgi:hypothetical protein
LVRSRAPQFDLPRVEICPDALPCLSLFLTRPIATAKL